MKGIVIVLSCLLVLSGCMKENDGASGPQRQPAVPTPQAGPPSDMSVTTTEVLWAMAQAMRCKEVSEADKARLASVYGRFAAIVEISRPRQDGPAEK